MYCVSYPLYPTAIPSVIASTEERGEGAGRTHAPVPTQAERPGPGQDPERPEEREKPEKPEKPEDSKSPGPVQGVTHEPPVYMRTAAMTSDELEARVKTLEVAVLFLALASAVSTLLLVRLALRAGSNRRTKGR